jgi:EAL domain-containing protein (putative c-di-GMP-specific phosphodiesterase class I)
MMAIDSPTLHAPGLKHQLAIALEKNEFEMYYQPLIDMRDESMRGVEALIRWHHPDLGLLNPSEFIPLAEETGVIVEMGAWALRQACGDLHRLQESSPTELMLSVNVSPRQLQEPGYLAELADIVRETGIRPRLLQLEITESIFLNDSLRIGGLFNAMRALGVKIAFDDFGTGYSSLSYLERFPVDVVKIDRYFVQRMSKSYMHTEIVQMMVDLAHTIGMNVSAEGVESSDQAEALTKFGCNIAQGFLYSRPVPLPGITAMLEATPAEARRGVSSVGAGARWATAK